MAKAAVLGSASIDVTLDLVVTDVTVEIDPDDTGPLSAVRFGPGATAQLDFAYDVDLPSGSADYIIDIALDVLSLRAIFENPFPVGDDFLLIDVLDARRGASPLEVFSATLFLADLTRGELAAGAPLDTVLNLLAADSGSFVIAQPAMGLLPAGLISGSYDLNPGATPGAAGGRAELYYAADGVFAALRQPLLGALPESVSDVIQGTGLAGPGLLDSFRGFRADLDLEIDVNAVTSKAALAPVPLPAGALLLPAGLGALMLLRRRRRRAS